MGQGGRGGGPPDGAAGDLLAAELPPGAARFAAAVVRQVAHPLGGSPGGPLEELATARALVRIFRAAGDPIPPGAERSTAPALAVESVLLSAIFQNLDLLYEDGCEAADGISLLLMQCAWAPDGENDPTHG
jgi:hypothetical protein